MNATLTPPPGLRSSQSEGRLNPPHPGTALVRHPAFSPASPVITIRELLLAAQCLGLKEQVVSQATRIAALEEHARSDAAKIAELLRRNQQLTASLHRAACAG